MAIDKSLSQYQQNLLKGTTLGALKRAGITDTPIQQAVNYPTPRTTVQAPKVQNISLPKSQASMPTGGTSFQPTAEVKAAPPVANLINQSPGGAGLGSFDSGKYNALAKSFYDQTAKKDNYLDQAVSDFLNRPYGPTVEQAGTADDAVAWPQDQGVEVGENWSQGFNDNEMQSAFSSGNQDTQNLITNLVDNGTSIFNNNPFLINALKTGTQWQAQKAVGGLLAKELGFAGVGAAGGLPGMALGWLVGKAFDFFTGKGKDANKLPKNVFGLPLTDTGSKEDTGENTDFEQNLIDQGAGVQIAPGQPVVAPGEIPVTQEEIDKYNEDTYGGVDAGTADVQDYADIYEPPTPVYTPPSPVRDSGGDSGGGGGSSSSDQGETSSDSGFSDSGGWADDGYWSKGGRVTKALGGRMDKALTGRRRDI